MSSIRGGSAPDEKQRTQINNGNLFDLLDEVGESFVVERLALGDLVVIGMINDQGLGGVVDADGFFSGAVHPLNDQKVEGRMILDSLFRVCPALQ